MNLIWTEQAAARVRGEVETLSLANTVAADKLAKRVQEASDVLRRFAYAGVMTRIGLRKYVVPNTRLILLYQVEDMNVRIMACYDGRENWQARHKS